MNGTVGPRKRSSAPLGLLGMLTLVVAIEKLEMRNNFDFMENVAVSWKYTGRVSPRKIRGNDVLFFGDSLVKFGLLPQVVKEKAGVRCYNLALQSGAAPSSYFMLRRALNAGARPKAVVVDFARGILGDGPASVARPYPWPDLLTFREAVELCATARDPDLFASIVVRWLLHSDKGRYEVRANIRAALKGGRTGQRDIAPALMRNWNTNGGGQANPKVATFADPVVPPNAPIKKGTWVCDPANAAYVRRFLELAERKGITVYWLLPPVTPGTLSSWVHSGDEQLYLDFVRAETSRFHNVVIVDGRNAGYMPPAFVDGVHLDRDGAAALSAGVGEILKRGIARPRPGPVAWVNLPHFSEHPTQLPVEDVGQSRLALISLWRTVK